MPILSAHIVPHPPLIVPAVGRGSERGIQRTIESYHLTAKAIAEANPETIIIVSPHAPAYADCFQISGGVSASGSFTQFGAPEVQFDVRYDTELSAAIAATAHARGIPVTVQAGHPDAPAPLDHGTMVPLFFIEQVMKDYKLVRLSIAGLDLERHFDYGVCIREAIGDTRAVLVASGDLSHRLTASGPYGFNENGPVFDKQITEAMAAGDFSEFFAFDEDTLEGAAECGLRGFAILAGALDGLPLRVAFRSYEGPFGVGYGVCSYDIMDFHVYLARQSLRTYLETGTYLTCPPVPDELRVSGYGAFVSFKKHGELRGCIGTITGIQADLAHEIIANAVSAGTRDPRFPPISPDELDTLDISVDVLFAPEPSELSALDPGKYGVIVSAGHRRGLLLPNLEGIDSVPQQVSIALQKAGIRPSEPFEVERFEVVRHH